MICDFTKEGICLLLTEFICGLLQVLKVNISTQINLAGLSKDMRELVLVNTLQRQKMLLVFDATKPICRKK